MGFRETRETYRETKKGERDNVELGRGYRLAKKAEAYLEGSGEELDPAEIGAIAHRFVRGPNPSNILLGARLYEKLGKTRKVQRTIPELDRILNTRYDLADGTRQEIKALLERNKKRQDEGGLAGRVGVFALFIAGGAALSLGSLTITGNAVSNLTRTTPGLSGIILFIAGLTGLFFYFKGK